MASKLECPMCSENFKNPRLLPCGHSFCNQCLEGWLKSTSKTQGQTLSTKQCTIQQQNELPDNLPCPECHEEHPLPVQGVAGFKKNFALERAADDTPKCQNCTTGREALTKCVECDGWLCEKCSDLHKQGLTKKHEIVSIHEANSRDSSKGVVGTSQYKSCSHHNNKLIEYFCIKCKVACCQSGSLTEHKHHDCVTLDERISDIGKEIQVLLKAFSPVSTKTDELEESWENGMKYKKPNTTEVRDQIEKIEKHFVKLVRNCAKKLLDEVQHDDAEFMKSYQTAKQEVTKVKEQITSSESDVKGWLKRRIPHELYSQEQEKKQKLDQSTVMRSLPQPVWNIFSLDQPQVNIETEISKIFGTLKKTVKYEEHIKYWKPVLLRTINVRTPGDTNICYLWDVAFVDDGNIAVSDWGLGNAKIKVFTTGGKLVHHSKQGLFCNPGYISPLPGDKDHLLVIDSNKNLLKCNIKNQEFITSRVRVSSNLAGLSTTRSGNQDIVIIGDRKAKAILHVDVNGHVLKEVKVEYDIACKMCYIAGHPEYQTIIISNSNKGIFAINNGEKLWQVDKELQTPKGVIIIGTGEVLVADAHSHRVMLVSKDGQVLDTLLSAEDGLYQPMGLAYSEEQHLLAVAEWSSQLLKLYHY